MYPLSGGKRVHLRMPPRPIELDFSSLLPHAESYCSSICCISVPRANTSPRSTSSTPMDRSRGDLVLPIPPMAMTRTTDLDNTLAIPLALLSPTFAEQ